MRWAAAAETRDGDYTHTYSKYEYGLADPFIALLAKLAHYYGVTLDGLILDELREAY
ncbi:helix-turn-helix transcriptional regulator [Sphingobacterium olei]|uniref:Helix-turn-helix transcriptional regulator n=1 Tax=Sphingobacterium olei TaxID=2571155 RepID=A0A4U0NHV5_9SPHI|nr:helix-turn-helix transcriptional regulator [Sphingobacterium olei]TJZ53805.1 helix-turn-helix transcriptional regulator [Sphingobacterium olei]